jgi:translation initiation factor IF-3
VPVPRRFDRSLPERDSTRINERIRVPEVRLIGPDGQQVGILKTAEALRIAQEQDLDLVEVAPDAKPPVCRILDYSKYKYEQNQRQKAARKHQQQIVIREIKFRPKIAEHDYVTKKGHVTRFLKARDKVKVTIMFRGREVAHPERGEIILNRLAEELGELAVVEQRPQQDGRNMTMMLGPGRLAMAEESEPATATAASGGKDSRRHRVADQKAAAKAPEAEPEPAPEPAPEPEPEAPAAEEAAAATNGAAAPEAEAAPAEKPKKAPAKKPAAKKAPAKKAEPAAEVDGAADGEAPAKPAAKKPAARKPAAKAATKSS